MFPPPFSFIYPTPLLYDRVSRGIYKKHRLTRGSFFFCFFGIRLSEMYYITAECEPKVSDGNSWLNQIRTLRGLPEITITDENELMSKLRIEYLREFWGEGQIFFMYKRLFVNILNTENGHNTSTYGASAARYVPPMPAKEIENR